MHPIYSRLEDKFNNGKERIEGYERRDVVSSTEPDSFTARELRFVYEIMKGDSGKEPFITTIAPSLQTAAIAAIRYFTNTNAITHGVDHNTGRVIIQSLGQK